MPRGLERLHEELTAARARVDTIITSAGQRDQENLAAFHLDAGRRAFEREADREAEQELRRALYLSPYLAEAHLLLGRLYLRGGRAGDAVQALKIALWSEETVAAHVGLAEALLQVAGPGRGARRGGPGAGPGPAVGRRRSRSRPGLAASVLKFCSVFTLWQRPTTTRFARFS